MSYKFNPFTGKLDIVGSGSSGGVNVEIPSGSLYNQSTGTGGTTFTVSNTPKFVVADNGTMFAGFGYTFSAGTITTTNPVTQFIRSIY